MTHDIRPLSPEVSAHRVFQRLRYLAQQGQFDVDPGPEPCAQVGGAGEDVAEPLVPHELPAFLLDQKLHLREKSQSVFVGRMCTCCSYTADR